MGFNPVSMRSWPSRRVLVLPLTAAIGAAVAIPVLAAPGVAHADQTVTATVVLRTPAGGEQLAQAGDLPRTARLARLVDTQPAAGDQSAVVADATAAGLTLDNVTPWSFVVHGPTSAVRGLAALPEVASVLPSGGPQAVAADAQEVPLSGAQLRTAYQASGAPAFGITPVIATIQLSGWDSSELGAYVTNANSQHGAGLPAPPAGEYTAVSVGGASTTSGGVAGGSNEVALDQESIYAVDPYARQRAYFTGSDTASMAAALNQVAADAQSNPGLVALSISWVFCEGDYSTTGSGRALLGAMHQALANVVAAGVTVFAATGDSGSNCQNRTTQGVSYPASDPLVLAVGGTSLTLGPTAETGWGGSGGGESTAGSQTWQEGVIPGETNRWLPDIAAAADPNTGFELWHDGGFGQLGGTSLASPVSAAGYVAQLGSVGAVNGGLGDLHGALYSAEAGDFRDITSGSNGGYSANTGWDAVTGLGAPLWHPIVSQLLSAPVISVPAIVTSRTVPVSVFAPAGQDFIAWTTGSGARPAGCGTSTGQPVSPAAVTVPADGTYTIWAVGYVGLHKCFMVSTTTVVNTGQPPPAPTTSAPTPTKTTPIDAPTTTSTGAPVTTTPAPHTTLPVLPVTTSATFSPAPTTPGTTVSAPFPTGPAGIAPPTRIIGSTDVTPPTVKVTARQTSPAAAAISYTWKASDGTGSGVASVQATVFRDGKAVWTAAVHATGTLSIAGTPGHSYRVGIVAGDVAGNMAGFASNVVRLPFDDRSFRIGKAWHRASSRAAYDGSYLRSAAKGAAASITATGRTFALLTTTGPAQGIVSVSVDGRWVRDLSLYSKAAHASVSIVLARFHTAGAHRITLVVKGSRPAHSTGTAVALDGLIAL